MFLSLYELLVVRLGGLKPAEGGLKPTVNNVLTLLAAGFSPRSAQFIARKCITEQISALKG